MSDGNYVVATLAVFISQKGSEEEEHRFYVPENLLWSAEGLAYLFEVTRKEKLSRPGDKTFDEDEWGSWHLARIETIADDEVCTYLVDGIEPQPPSRQTLKNGKRKGEHTK